MASWRNGIAPKAQWKLGLGIVLKFVFAKVLDVHSQHFIFFITYERSQYVSALYYTRLEMFAGDKHSSLLGPFISYEENSVVKTAPGFAPEACIIKLIMAVIYGFRNKLEYLSLNTRLGWKRSPGTNTLAYYGICKLRQ